MQVFPQLRIARPTSHRDEILSFYQGGLGLRVLGHFSDHDGFDGVMLGQPGSPYHFEFTTRRREPVRPSPTHEDLLVFYFPDRLEWEKTVERLEKEGFESVKSFNPYWDKHGKTFQDPDGYRVVVQNGPWPAKT